MSMANECDRCGELYRPTKGSANIDGFGVASGNCGSFDTWSDIDLCPKCATLVIDALGSALNDPPT